MTYADVYVGNLGQGGDPLDWGGTWNGNTPARLSPFFPNGGEAFRALVSRIETGELSGKQVDWGGWAANVSKQQIVEFFDEIHPPNAERSSFSNVNANMDNARNFVRDLPDGRYALVACEL